MDMTKRRIRALLLEDLPDLRNIMKQVLDRRGYELVLFETPAICPLQLSPTCRCSENERCVDLILADLKMPSVSGLEFVENQRIKNCKSPYVGLMSGSWSDDETERANRLNCKIFRKPFSLMELDKWLDEIEKNIDLEFDLKDWVIHSKRTEVQHEK